MSEVPLYRAWTGGRDIKKRPSLYDPLRTLGIGPRQGPRGVRDLVSEVPL